MATMLSAPVVYGKVGKPDAPKPTKQPQPTKPTKPNLPKPTKQPACAKGIKICGKAPCTSIITDANRDAAISDWTSNGTGGSYCNISTWDTSRVTDLHSKSMSCLFSMIEVPLCCYISCVNVYFHPPKTYSILTTMDFLMMTCPNGTPVRLRI
jgi:hypothetical protein